MGYEKNGKLMEYFEMEVDCGNCPMTDLEKHVIFEEIAQIFKNHAMRLDSYEG